jgi:hypothetical protein
MHSGLNVRVTKKSMIFKALLKLTNQPILIAGGSEISRTKIDH